MARVTHVAKAMKDQRSCSNCGTEIKKGDAYSWAKPGFRAAKVTHCTKCGWRPSQLTGSGLKSQVYAAQEALQDAVDAWTPTEDDADLGDLQSALEDAAAEAEEVASEYETAAEAMGEAGEEIRELGEMVQNWSDELGNVSLDEWEPDEEATEEERTEAFETWVDDQRQAVMDAADALEI